MTQVVDAPVVAPDPVRIDPRILERREEVARQRSRHRLRIAGAVGVVVVMVGGGWAALHSSALATRHVTVIGAVHTGVAPVVAAVGATGQPLIDVNPGQVAARVEALPWVAHATVARHWPDDITVTVDERTPVAAVALPGHGAAVVDATGHVLAVGPVAPPGTVVLATAVIPGPPGSVLGATAAPGLTVLGGVPPVLRPRLEQVEVAPDGDVTLALTGHIDVTLGPAVELQSKFVSLLSVLLDVPPTAPEDIDVTVPDAPAVGPPVPLGGGGRPAAPPPAPPRVLATGRVPQMRAAG
ncbi:MAG TPA: FtsQ-type POTRA domain-containing protein [Acidimicrobiales bacterium]|nr:FtsQ-type POTRA domain-containing protein [Acidimicrobiales bacterium]